MKYYLTFVVLGLLMGGVCVVLELHGSPPPPAMAMVGLFGAHGDELARRGPCADGACRQGRLAAPLPVSCAIQEKSLPA